MLAATLETNLGGLAAELFAPKSTVRRLTAWSFYPDVNKLQQCTGCLQPAWSCWLELLCWRCMCAQLQQLGRLAPLQRKAGLQEGEALVSDAKRRLLSSAVKRCCNAMLPPPAGASHGVAAALAARVAAFLWPAGGCRSGC